MTVSARSYLFNLSCALLTSVSVMAFSAAAQTSNSTAAPAKTSAPAAESTGKVNASPKKTAPTGDTAKSAKIPSGVSASPRKSSISAKGKNSESFAKAPGKPAGTMTIEKIVVKGNRKIEAEAIRLKLVSKEGGTFDEDEIRRDIRELFNTGFFYDVVVERTEGSKITLTYSVVEKPSVVEIQYKGNKELEDDDLKEASQIKPYEILNIAKIKEATEKLEKAYEDKGFFLANVTYQIKNGESPDQVTLIFNIQENEKVRVKRISFIGNKKLSAGRLKGIMATQEGGFFSFIGGSGSYKQEAFERDVQMLSYLYFNEGYVQVKVDRPQVYVTPDKKGIFISIRVEEGEQFKVGNVDFTGDLLFARAELFESTEIQQQGIFKYEVLQNDLRTLQAKYGDLGYAYANIIPRLRQREAEKEVDITFEIDKGNKVYLNRINVIGNTKTRDKVLRRELRINEGELYNETRKRESLDNVKRLGFFEEVNFNTKTPKGRNDLMDIDIVVKERNTGTIQIGAGYSNFNGFVFNGQVSQINFMGKGQKLSASMDLSKRQSLYKLSFTEPYVKDTEWSAGFDFYQSQRVLTEYTETTLGGALRVGHPLAPYLDGSLRYRLDRTNLSLDPEKGDQELFPVETANGTISSVTAILEYDKRDDRFAPSKGIYSSLSLEYAGIGGDKDFTKGLATFRFYKKLFWDVVWRNNINYGFISSNVSNREVPYNQLFLLGGANSLRGFDWFTIGRRKESRNAYEDSISGGATEEQARADAMRPFGGTQQILYNLEFQFPLINEAGIKGVVFYDTGMAENYISLSGLRQNVGFGFRWFSPIGPLRFEWGFPLNRQERYRENPVNFEFAIGSPF